MTLLHHDDLAQTARKRRNLLAVRRVDHCKFHQTDTTARQLVLAEAYHLQCLNKVGVRLACGDDSDAIITAATHHVEVVRDTIAAGQLQADRFTRQLEFIEYGLQNVRGDRMPIRLPAVFHRRNGRHDALRIYPGDSSEIGNVGDNLQCSVTSHCSGRVTGGALGPGRTGLVGPDQPGPLA
jgi:hypothetical protein